MIYALVREVKSSARFINKMVYFYGTNNSFVSKHFKLDQNELKKVIATMDTEYRDCQDGIEFKLCKLCSKGNKTHSGNIWKLRVRTDGSFYCFRCSHSGNWLNFKELVYGNIVF